MKAPVSNSLLFNIQNFLLRLSSKIIDNMNKYAMLYKEKTKETGNMLLSKKTTLQVNEAYANIINHMCYAAYKLWNVCNYERVNYKQLVQDGQLAGYPDWYYQRAAHKDNIWFKSLPSQTAQEVCKLLDKGWKSFHKLQQTGGVENCKPPRYKNDLMPITYMQKGIQQGKEYVRLSMPKQLKEHMLQAYGIKEDYIFIHNQLMDGFENIKQIKLYPAEKGMCWSG